MWVYFSEVNSNSSLSVRKTITHGTPARIGQVGVFSFFLYCPDIIQTLGYSCTVNLTNPLGESSQTLALTSKKKTFALLDGETNQNAYPFVNGTTYFGYEYYFDTETTLNMSGTWKAVVKYYTGTQVMVTGEFSFFVENSEINVEDDITITYSTFQSVQKQMSNKLDRNSSLYVKVFDFGASLNGSNIVYTNATTDAKKVLTILGEDDLFLNQYDYKLYKVTSNDYSETTEKYTLVYQYVCAIKDYLEKKTYSGEDGDPQVYGINEDEEQILINIATDANNNSIPIRNDKGNIKVSITPIANQDATSKKYVDDELAKKVNKTTKINGKALSNDVALSTDDIKYAQDNANVNYLQDESTITASLEKLDTECAKKVNKITNTNNIPMAYVETSYGTILGVVTNLNQSNSLLLRDGNGKSQVSTPISTDNDLTIANKGYVDTKVSDVVAVANGKTQSYVTTLIESDGNKYIYCGDSEVATGGSLPTTKTAISITSTTSSFAPTKQYVYIMYPDKMTVRTTINLANLKVGDVIYITDTDVPDFWFGSSSVFYKLETTKVDLSNFYTTYIQIGNTKITEEQLIKLLALLGE